MSETWDEATTGAEIKRLYEAAGIQAIPTCNGRPLEDRKLYQHPKLVQLRERAGEGH